MKVATMKCGVVRYVDATHTWERTRGDRGTKRRRATRSPFTMPKEREADTVTSPHGGSTDSTRAQSRVPFFHRNRPTESQRCRLFPRRGKSEEWTCACKTTRSWDERTARRTWPRASWWLCTATGYCLSRASLRQVDRCWTAVLYTWN